MFDYIAPFSPAFYGYYRKCPFQSRLRGLTSTLLILWFLLYVFYAILTEIYFDKFRSSTGDGTSPRPRLSPEGIGRRAPPLLPGEARHPADRPPGVRGRRYSGEVGRPGGTGRRAAHARGQLRGCRCGVRPRGGGAWGPPATERSGRWGRSQPRVCRRGRRRR